MTLVYRISSGGSGAGGSGDGGSLEAPPPPPHQISSEENSNNATGTNKINLCIANLPELENISLFLLSNDIKREKSLIIRPIIVLLRNRLLYIAE